MHIHSAPANHRPSCVARNTNWNTSVKLGGVDEHSADLSIWYTRSRNVVCDCKNTRHVLCCCRMFMMLQGVMIQLFFCLLFQDYLWNVLFISNQKQHVPCSVACTRNLDVCMIHLPLHNTLVKPPCTAKQKLIIQRKLESLNQTCMSTKRFVTSTLQTYNDKNGILYLYIKYCDSN